MDLVAATSASLTIDVASRLAGCTSMRDGQKDGRTRTYVPRYGNIYRNALAIRLILLLSAGENATKYLIRRRWHVLHWEALGNATTSDVTVAVWKTCFFLISSTLQYEINSVVPL